MALVAIAILGIAMVAAALRPGAASPSPMTEHLSAAAATDTPPFYMIAGASGFAGQSSTPPPTQSTPPSASSYPNASNTGVAAGTALVDVPGQVTSGPGWSYSDGTVSIRTANAVFSGYNVTGTVEVYAVGVTVKNNVITASGNTWAIGLRNTASNVTISDNTIQGPAKTGPTRLQYGIFGDLGGDLGSQVLRNNLRLIDHPIQMERGLVQDNYAHDIAVNGTGTNADHVDVFFSGGGTTDPLTIRHNTFINDWTGDGLAGCIMLNNAFGVQSNRTIEDNYLAGGNFTIYSGQAPSGINDIIRNNVFSTQIFPNSGQYAPVRDLANNSGNTWSNNTWADGPNAGKAIVP